MDQETIKLTERRHTEKEKYHIFSFTCRNQNVRGEDGIGIKMEIFVCR
jgi:hypothetical protein